MGRLSVFLGPSRPRLEPWVHLSWLWLLVFLVCCGAAFSGQASSARVFWGSVFKSERLGVVTEASSVLFVVALACLITGVSLVSRSSLLRASQSLGILTRKERLLCGRFRHTTFGERL